MTERTSQRARLDVLRAQDSRGKAAPAVWLLDDSALERRRATDVLAPTYGVTAFADGASMLERLDSGVAPDALVLDWHMPDLSGHEVLTFIRSTRDAAALPIVVLTASAANSTDLLTAMAAGANDFVAKPYSAEELRARVKSLVQVRALYANVQRLEAEGHARREFEQQLIGIVAHDLRNPLAAIAFSAATLARTTSLEGSAARSVRRIASAAERANRMIRDLLDFSLARTGAGIPIERTTTDLGVVARDVVAEVGVAHPGRSIGLRTRGDARGLLDGDRLAQLLTNLLANALKYGSTDAPVDVAIDGTDDTLTLSVHNAGTPIPASLRPRLFAPMSRGDEQIDRTGRSVGLGLYIVDQIARAHGGSISVESVDGSGTTFTVLLPRNPTAR